MPVSQIQAADIADLLNSTRAQEEPLKVTDIASDIQDWIVLPQVLNRQHVKFGTGTSFDFTLNTSWDSNFKWAGLFEADNLTQIDGTVKGSVPYRHVQSGWLMDVRQERMNMAPNRIWDFKQMKRHQMLGGWAQGWEDSFWTIPASGDVVNPFGLFYYLVYNATEGFNGGNHANFSGGPAGVSRTDYTDWKHYAGQYTYVSQSDLMDMIDRAMTYCQWKPIPQAAVSGHGSGRPRWGLYTLYDPVIQGMKEIIRGNNDSLGSFDLDPLGQVTIRRIPVQYVPQLQQYESTADPFFGLDWDQFGFVFLEDRYMVESPVRVRADHHNEVEQFLDCSGNWVMTNSRTSFAFAKSDWTA